VEQQVGQDIDSLVSADMQSDEFKSRLDSAFRLGKEEVSNAASLMTTPGFRDMTTVTWTYRARGAPRPGCLC
jgi:hypothetical protein